MPVILSVLGVAALAVVSLFVGVADLSPASLLAGDGEGQGQAMLVLLASRIPRTAALILAGAGMAVAGLIMQMLGRNKFIEPTTAGTTESAVLGVLVMTLVAPGLPIVARMVAATLFGLAGTGLFLLILRRVPLRSPLVVPLIGIMLGGVITSATVFLAYRFDMMQSLGAWTHGDFSGVLRGRYEMLWLALGLTVAAYLAADRFTVAGMGQSFTTNLGLRYGRVVALGLLIVSMVSAVVVVTCGVIPFLGLIVPNIVSLALGDNMRRSLPFVVLLGAGFVLACDIAGRLVVRPYEVPLSTMMGIVGSVVFLTLLLRKGSSHAA